VALSEASPNGNSLHGFEGQRYLLPDQRIKVYLSVQHRHVVSYRVRVGSTVSSAGKKGFTVGATQNLHFGTVPEPLQRNKDTFSRWELICQVLRVRDRKDAYRGKKYLKVLADAKLSACISLEHRLREE
jgi:hypothetical protein